MQYHKDVTSGPPCNLRARGHNKYDFFSDAPCNFLNIKSMLRTCSDFTVLLLLTIRIVLVIFIYHKWQQIIK